MIDLIPVTAMILYRRAIVAASDSGTKVLPVPKRLLIVDDSPIIRKLLRETFELQEGWEICGEAADGREGVEKAQQLKPDLIVLDLSMPVMNGLHAARELTRLLPWVPVLMYTSFETAHLKREALSAGVRTIVSKSESLEALVSSIQGLLAPVS
jgi:DNA-binding NarL/FixJ family response regulator